MNSKVASKIKEYMENGFADFQCIKNYTENCDSYFLGKCVSCEDGFSLTENY